MPKALPSRYRRKSSPSKAYAHPRVAPKRYLRYYVLCAVCIATLLYLLTSKGSVVQDLRVLHYQPAHKPPPQTNSTAGEVHWFSDWKWLKPFSASITLDNDRSVLPPLQSRPVIYTYYDADEKQDDEIRSAENRLLLLWRRAWWAQGFRPVVLGKSEATHNPLYESAMSRNLQPQLKSDLIRWLAWGQMGTGILANWLVLPMSARDEHLLRTLRKGEYPNLARYEGLGGGLISGEKSAINNAIKEALESTKLQESRTVIDALSRQTLVVEPTPSEIAFYDSKTNAEYYKSVTASIADNKAEGLGALAVLINSHLHLTFLNNYPDGFAVLTPYPESAGILSQNAFLLAEALHSCPQSPIPSSCPPNRQNCRPCSTTTPLAITIQEQSTNSSTAFTLGTVPHPFTLAALKRKTKEITTRYIRRDTERDPWLDLVTAKILGKELGGQGRIVSFKKLVAGEWGYARGLWMTETEELERKGLEYHFGFSLPGLNVSSKATSSNHFTIPLSSDSQPHQLDQLDKETLRRTTKHQQDILTTSLDTVLETEKKSLTGSSSSSSPKTRKNDRIRTREMVEAWNLADTEAWRFVRAFAAREKVERTKWEEEERVFAGGDPDSGQGSWRWFDKS